MQMEAAATNKKVVKWRNEVPFCSISHPGALVQDTYLEVHEQRLLISAGLADVQLEKVVEQEVH